MPGAIEAVHERDCYLLAVVNACAVLNSRYIDDPRCSCALKKCKYSYVVGPRLTQVDGHVVCHVRVAVGVYGK